MKSASTRLFAAGALAIASSLAAPAAFAQAVFTPGVATTATNCDLGGTVSSVSCTQSGVSVQMTAWGFGATLNGTLRTGFTQGTMGDYGTSGIGAYTGSNETGTNSHHAFDNMTSNCGNNGTTTTNCGGSIEALLLTFTSGAVNLSSYGINYNGGDADVMLWAWTGGTFNGMTSQMVAGNSVASGVNSQAASMTGWTLVSTRDYGNGGTGDTAVSNSIYSSYFMITTYFGANTVASGSSGLNFGNDSFKIDAFTANACSGTVTGNTCTPGRMPEPGSLALAGVAMVGAFAARRRQTFVKRSK